MVRKGDARYTAMIVNAKTMTGGQVEISGDLPNISVNIPTATPSGYLSFMLVYAEFPGVIFGS